MLILSRKTGEAIVIGEEIEIRVVSVKGDQVKLGIDAPKHVDIYRREIVDEIQEENKHATIFSGDLAKLVKKSQNP
ncbi:carbon storage regulator CsrA [Fervidibacillus halotolerans]|uniref:Translational regulator CsrA n=1 Tax=Fervidibacillus halotolerans TaxID=2980027 RepID=A0A9E8LYD3_9BACI|nr:carbon storage regulator CsrA [Fervidibacillus halotolerans]WAA12023.1 carbon storage regulator CsrA [Fervidibacillus halotolerans]